MNTLISENVHWDLLEPYRSGKFESVIEDAYIERKTDRITVLIRVNFVVPYEDEKRLKTAVLRAVPGLSSVQIRYLYDRDHMALTEEGIIWFLFPRILVSFGSSAVHAVEFSKYKTEGQKITIPCFSRIMAEKLNREVAAEIVRRLREDFGIEREIVFFPDEEKASGSEGQEKSGGKGGAMRSSEDAMLESWALSQEEEPDPSSIPPWEDTLSESAKTNRASLEGGEMDSHENREKARSRRKASSSSKGFERVFGKDIHEEPLPISRITEDSGTVAVKGWIYHIESKPIKNGRCIVTMLVTDKKSSACLKTFFKQEKWEQLSENLHEGDYILAEGTAEWDSFERAVDIMVKSIMKGEAPKRMDTWDGPHRVELHCHTKMSQMDAINDPDQIVKTAAEWGQPAVAITDHGVVQGFPDAANMAAKLEKKGKPIKVLYGMEGYLLDDKDCIRPDGTIDYKKKNTNHIIILCRTQEGLKNLYKLVSISHLKYFFKRARIPRTVLNQYREGLILGSACEAGELFRAIEHGLPEEEIESIASYYDYLEIQPIVNNEFLLRNGTYHSEEELRDINRKIVNLGEKLRKPVVATTDAHYDEPESAVYRNIILASMGFKDAAEGHGLYLRTTQEMMEEFSYLGEEKAREVVIDNTNLIASWIDDGIKPVPDEKYPPKIEGAEKTLRDTCYKNAHEMYGDPLPEPIQERLDTELNAIISNGYAVMYVSAQLLVKKSLEDGYLVGSRGSVGSSFAATMAGITEVNPLNPHYLCPKCHYLEWGDMQQYDNGIDMPKKNCPRCGTELKRDGFAIPFATFLGFSGNKEPDIDLNFAGEYQPRAHKYVGVIFGEENVFKAGTVGTVAEKTAFGFVRHYFDETGLPVNKFEVDRLKMGCTGVKRTTGQHPGGIIIVPRDHEIYEFCPIQHPANDTKTDIITTHFDYHKIDKNLLKLDILGHNVPSMIRQLQDMTGVDPLHLDLTDQKVLSIFNGIKELHIKDPEYRFHHGTFGIPEFGTSFTRQMLDDVKPKRFEDLVRMSGFSHGTDVWLNNAQDYIREGIATMREVISTRDDIMNFCLLHGIDNENSFKIMEEVRKKNLILTEEHKEMMKEHGIPDWYIDSCSKIKYMFPRAHAVAYVMMSFRMAWFKVYYPQEFYATYFTSVLSNFDAETTMKGKDAVLARMDAIRAKGKEASQKEKDDVTVLEVIYEMYARGYSFLPARLGHSKATKFWTEDGKVLLPFAAYEGVGETAAKDLTKAYNEKPFSTVEDCSERAGIGKAVIEVLREHGVFEGIPESDQICWAI
ncbi:MAG: PolC-type DNA polymerase III [Eubacteriales bacterium]|nr:PolC-type DNA polymerase III [Eubacteriales bacterium]